MHRRLAEIVDEPELRARHLALAATSGDDVTLRALDKAAESARARGAPAAAAELMDLAIGLGGDTPERRLRSALHHFDAGDHERAAAMLQETIDRLPPGDLRAEALCRLAVVRLYTEGFFEATGLLQRALSEVGRRQPAARANPDHVGVRTHPRQSDPRGAGTAEQAVAQAERLNSAALAQPGAGHASHPGVHERAKASTKRARVAHWSWRTSRPSRPWCSDQRVQHALLLEWTGELDGRTRRWRRSGCAAWRRARRASTSSSPNTW